MKNKYLLNSLIGLTLLLVLFSFVGVLYEAGKTRITGMAISGQADEDFIFTYSPIVVTSDEAIKQEHFTAIDNMSEAGMNYAKIQFYPNYPDSMIDDYLNRIKEKGYKLALGYSPGHYSWLEPYELTNVVADEGKQFLNASCLDYDVCKNWNKAVLGAIDPNYTGILWQNTLDNTKNITKNASKFLKPEIVMLDTEIWQDPVNVEKLFDDCGCKIVQEGIGSNTYKQKWLERAIEIKEAVKQVDDSIGVYFYHELPENGERCAQSPYGNYGCDKTGWLLNGSGDSPTPALYILPNLELLETNTKTMNLAGAVPYLSFSYMYGYSNYFVYSSEYPGLEKDNIVFDLSVSREAGRILRQAGAKGFEIYPNAYLDKKFYGEEYYNLWLEHAREMIAGFKEGQDYIETNKIRNPSFEAFRTRAMGYDIELYNSGNCNCNTLNGSVKFEPVFWTWQDSNSSYEDIYNPYFSNLSRDKQLGMYAWRHTRLGDIGNRTISSANFSISENENYTFSIWTKASLTNGKIKFFLVNNLTLAEEAIGETNFQSSWNEFKQNIEINSGEYNLKIFVEDNTGQKVDIYFDNVSLTQGSITIKCGDGSCNGNENCTTCPQDCDVCHITQTCAEKGGIICSADKICNGTEVSASDGECCLGNCITEIVIPDKTCTEQGGKICNATQYCNSTIGWASDGNCCLGECVEEETTEPPEKPDNYWFYGFIGGIGALIVGVVSYIIYEVNKPRFY